MPSHLQIETVNRYCNARCPMCSIKFVPEWDRDTGDEYSYTGRARPPQVMTLETFQAIASKFVPYLPQIKILSLHGCGEPLLDQTLAEKVRFAKDLGFTEVGFTSNCSLLTKSISEKLLSAGLNCLIPSIDGTTREVHEAIRPRTSYDEIVSNVRHFVSHRDRHGFNCKVLVRMVRQKLNIGQWDEFNRVWSACLDTAKGDAVLGIDVHNTGGKIVNFDAMKVGDFADRSSRFDRAYQEARGGLCPDLFSRLSIFASGEVALCSADQSRYFDMGNVLYTDPIDIFNNPVFSRYRENWSNGNYTELEHCRNCTIAISRLHRTGI